MNSEGAALRPTLVYVFTDLPDQPGTFSFAEIEAMAERGFPIEVICLRTRLADGAGARSLRARFPVLAVPYLSPGVAAAFGRTLLRRPAVTLSLLTRTIADTWRQPRILIKTLAILPKTCWFAERLRVGDSAGTRRLHAFWASLPGRAAWNISKLTDLPYTSWAHAGADIYNKRHQTESALRTVLSEAKLVLTCNQANLPYLSQVLSADAFARVVHHPHGVDLDRFQPVAPAVSSSEAKVRPLRLLSVGRLSPAKGFQLGIAACALLQTRGILCEYRIVGEGPWAGALTDAIEAAGLTDSVHLLGSRDQADLPDLYRWADTLLAPSIIGRAGGRDGLPNVVVEAMACGVPCIGSDAVGIPEAVRPGETGLLAPPGDPAGLADAIQRMADDPEARRSMGARAHAWVRTTFDRAACMDRLAELLQEPRHRQLDGDHGGPRDLQAKRVSNSGPGA